MVQLNTPSIFGAWQQGENAAFQQKQRQLQLLQFEQEQQAKQAAAQREAKLRDAIASGVDPSTPKGLGQLLRAGLSTEDYFKAIDTQSKIKLADIKGQTAQQTADAATMRAKVAEKNAETSAWQARQQIDLKRKEEMRLIQKFKQDTDKTEFEAASKFAQIIAGVPEEQRFQAHSKLQSQYGALFPRLFKGEYTPEVNVIVQALANSAASQTPLSNVAKIEEDFRRGRLSQQQRDAAIANATNTKGTRTTINPSTGAVVIEEGGMAAGNAQTSPVGFTSQQSVVSRNLNRLENIVTGKEGEIKQFFATGAPSATGVLGAWTPAGTAENLIKNIEANFTIQALQDDRKNNPTGASSFGPLTEREMEVVRQSVSTLRNSQTEEEFLRNLRDTTDLYNDLTRGNPTEIVNFFLSGKVNPFDAADAIKRKNPQNYMLSVPSLAGVQNLPPALQSAMSGMQVRDQQTGQTITINVPTPSGGGQGGQKIVVDY